MASIDLTQYGITSAAEIVHNPSFEFLYEEEMKPGLEGFDKAKEAVKGFESASGYLKREISNVLGLRKAPDLKFIADDSAEYSARIFEKLKNIKTSDDNDNDEN